MVTFSEFQQLKSLSPEEQDEILGGSTEEELNQLEAFENQSGQPSQQEFLPDLIQEAEQNRLATQQRLSQPINEQQFAGLSPEDQLERLNFRPQRENILSPDNRSREFIEKGLKLRDIPFQEIGSFGGGIVGGLGGAAVGSAVGPVGTFAGGTAGSIGGEAAGSVAGRRLDVLTGRTPEEDISQTVKESVRLDVAGGVGGASALEFAFRNANSITRVLSSVAGGIVGATAGKQADVATGRVPDESVGLSFIKSGAEEAAGRVLAVPVNIFGRKILKPILQSTVDIARSRAGKFGIDIKDNPVEASFLTSDTINTDKVVNPRDIIQAQENVLNQRILTTFEETGGEIGGKDFDKIKRTISLMKKTEQNSSEAIKVRNSISKKIKNILQDTNNIKAASIIKEQADLGDMTKRQLQRASRSFENQIKIISRELIPMRKRAEIDVTNLRKDLEVAANNLPNTISDQEEAALMRVIAKKIPKDKKVTRKEVFLDNEGLIQSRNVEDIIPAKTTMTFDEFKRLDNNVASLLPKIQPSQERQSKISGIYSNNFKPIFKDYKIRSVESKGPASIEASTHAAEKELANLMESQGSLLKSMIFTSVGGGEAVQIKKGVAAKNVLSKVFESRESWESTVRGLEKSNPDLIDVLRGRFKANIIKEVFDPKAGDVNFNKIVSLRKKFDDDTIKAIAGEDYLQKLDDSQLISLALESSKGLRNITPEQVGSLVTFVRKLSRPLAQGVAVMDAIINQGSKSFNVDGISDKLLFRKMQGVEGQRFYERLVNTPLDSPEAYNLYTQVVRELVVKGEDKNLLTREEFNNRSDVFINDIQSGISNIQQLIK